MKRSYTNATGFYSSSLGFSLRTEYNEQGFVTQMIKRDNKGRLQERYSYSYDDSNYCRRYFHYNQQDTIDFYFISYYNTNGFNYKTEEFNKKDSLVLKLMYEYDSAGHVINTLQYTRSGVKQFQKIVVYENGLPVNSTFILSSQKIPLKYHYEFEKFDAAGNWLQQKIFATYSSAMEVISREIEYYPNIR